MLDIFTKILSSVVSQMGQGAGGDKLGKIEKDLARKFDALEAQARRDAAKRWFFLFLVCAVLGLAALFAHRAMQKDVKAMIGERLDKEFSSAYLQQTIEDTAKKYTEQHLKEYVDSKLAARYKVAKLESLARLDSRRAYEELLALSGDPQYKDDAESGLFLVRKRYEALSYPFAPPAGADSAAEASVQMKLDPNEFSQAQVDALRPRLSRLAEESQKNYLVPDFIRFLKESDSLGASVGICRILAHNYGPQAGDYEFDKWVRYLEALDKNDVKIKNVL